MSDIFGKRYTNYYHFGMRVGITGFVSAEKKPDGKFSYVENCEICGDDTVMYIDKILPLTDCSLGGII